MCPTGWIQVKQLPFGCITKGREEIQEVHFDQRETGTISTRDEQMGEEIPSEEIKVVL